MTRMAQLTPNPLSGDSCCLSLDDCLVFGGQFVFSLWETPWHVKRNLSLSITSLGDCKAVSLDDNLSILMGAVLTRVTT